MDLKDNQLKEDKYFSKKINKNIDRNADDFFCVEDFYKEKFEKILCDNLSFKENNNSKIFKRYGLLINDKI